MTLPNIETAKDYPVGKTEERLQNVSSTAVGWRVTLTCDKFPVDLQGDLAIVHVYHVRDGGKHHVRSTRIQLNLGKLQKRDGTDALEWYIGGEYPYELVALDKDGQPTKDSFDANGKPMYRYLKGTEFIVEIESKLTFNSQVTIDAVESKQVRGLLPGVPVRTIRADGTFTL